MGYWIFRDFLGPHGRNLIHDWLHRLPAAVRADINARIRHLEVTEKLTRPHVGKLKGECKGLIELRVKVDKIQYRPLACYGPERGEITLLMGATTKPKHLLTS